MKDKLNLQEINDSLGLISDEIEGKMKLLQEKYGFQLDYAFKPITQEEIIKFKKENTPKRMK